MADSTTHLDLISGSVLQREVTFNELADALSPAMRGGRRVEKCTGLNFGFYIGRFSDSVTFNSYTVFLLDDDATNYIVAALDDGIITHAVDDTNWNDTDNYARQYLVITADGEVTSFEDHRQLIGLDLPE